MKTLSMRAKLEPRTRQLTADIARIPPRRRRQQHWRRPLDVVAAAASFKVFRPPGAQVEEGEQEQQQQQQRQSRRRRPVLLHIPGADGTGVSLGRQAELLSRAGFDVYSSSFEVFGEGEGGQGGEGEEKETEGRKRNKGGDPWEPLVDAAESSIRASFGESRGGGGGGRGGASAASVAVVVLAESFGACLALRLAARNPGLFSSLVLVNPATALGARRKRGRSEGKESASAPPRPRRPLSAALVGVAAATGVARLVPVPVYRAVASALTPLLLLNDDEDDNDEGEGENSSSSSSSSPSSAATAASTMMSLGGRGGATRRTTKGVAARLELLSQADPGEETLRKVRTKTLLVASARDALLPSVAECGRLCRLMTATAEAEAARVILPDSGHAALLESRVDMASVLERAGIGASSFDSSVASSSSFSSSPPSSPSSSAAPPLLPLPLPLPPPWALPDAEFDAAFESLGPLREVIRPLVTGAERLPFYSPFAPASENDENDENENSNVDDDDKKQQRRRPRRRRRPILFVGNHSRFGIYDLVFLLAELYARGIRARGLAHRAHFTTGSPLGPIFNRFGAVAASPRSAYKLLAQGEAVLLFPGGAAEVNKARGQDYRLMWKESADFVRLAARFDGCLIVPFAAVGAEEAYDVIADQKDILSNPLLAPLARRFFNSLDLTPEEALLPVAAVPLSGGLVPSLPIPLPARPERLYFEFGEPIDARALVDGAGAEEAYRRVRAAVEAAIGRQRARRASDPLRPARARLVEAAKRFAPRKLEF